MMFFLLLILCLGTFLRDFHVSSCDDNCADKPVFSSSRLVVQYGDQISASCSACQHACHSNQTGLEVSTGVTTQNGSMILWTVDNVTEWDTSAKCYYNADDGSQCCSSLPVTVYKPPDIVTISFYRSSWPMYPGGHYTLHCEVQDVAPVENLIVTFYKDQTILGQQQSKNKEKKPVTEAFTLNFIPTADDNGVMLRCEAKLELGPEGPQPPPVVMSQNTTATVYSILHRITVSGTVIHTVNTCLMLLLFALVGSFSV
ncbi:vascular cell adhesion protein 1-like [Chelmon rostratus]|uniref:vascular cell adhesion protein 1-like n=1 Tax=Chelmon rostratus TaxID=109905 RepID=UPI001BEA8E20|nr:vascular cell adhesion protein 1-like [Chelmon rostratus]